MKFKKKESERKIISPLQKNKKKKRIITLIILAIVIVAVFAILKLSNKGKQNEEKEVMTTSPTKNDIVLTVSGSGTITPKDRYEIVPLVNGDIIACPYEEGDVVKEGALLYEFDHESQDKDIESAKNSLTKSKLRNKKYLDANEFNTEYAKYTVRATGDGVISGFSLKTGDDVNAKANYGTIQNRTKITAAVPFNAAQCEKIKVGDSATVSLYPSMFRVNGTVTYKSTASSGYSNGAVVYDVEITINNANISITDTSASATIHTSEGEVESPKSGKLSYQDPVNIIPQVGGTVKSIPANIKNGTTVKTGDVLFTIDSADFLEEKRLAEFEYHDLEIALENAEDRLDNYRITAPISGTVITRNSKKGDTIGAGSNSVTLMVIADITAMKFTFQADETDIDKIELGQEVKVTADAIEDKEFSGEVTSIATEGVSNNGVSYYDVEVVINDYGQSESEGYLRSGMNVSAEIVYSKTENALCVPVSAVTKIGDQSYAFVQGNAKTSKQSDVTKTEAGKTGEKDDKAKNATISDKLAKMVPEGFSIVKVTTGATDGINIAVLSGLSESDVVYISESNNVLDPVTMMNGGGLSGEEMRDDRGQGGPHGGMGGM